MTANVALLIVQPRNASTGVRETIYLAGGGADYPYTYGGYDWKAGVVNMPQIATQLQFDGRNLANGAVPQVVQLDWMPGATAGMDDVLGLVFENAPFTLYHGAENSAGSLPAELLSGNVIDGKITEGRLVLRLADPSNDLKRPVIVDTFAGTGGTEGPAEWEGRPKRRAWGRVFNAEGWAIDSATNVYSFGDPARPWEAINAVRDKGVDATALNLVAWAGSVAATFAALQAEDVANGECAIAPSIAMVKWWTRPAGILAADVYGEQGAGYVESAPEIAERIVQSRSGPDFQTGTVAAAKSAKAYACGFFAESLQTQLSATLDYLLGGVGLLWVLDDSEIRIEEWAFGASQAEFTSVSAERSKIIAPLKERRLGYQANYKVHTSGDIAALVLYADGTSLDDFRTELDALLDDDILSKGEKPQVVREYNAILQQYNALYARSVALAVASSERSLATSAVNNLTSYLGGLSPAYNDTTEDTAISAAAFAGYFNTAYQRLANLNAALNINSGFTTATVTLFKRSLATPALPSTTATFTFSTGILTGHNNGWTQDIPSGSYDLFVTSALAVSSSDTDTIAAGEWSAATIMSANGVNIAPVFIFQRATSAPTLPSATVTYDFTDSSVTGLNNGWSAEIPSGTDPIWIAHATANSADDTDTIASGEWSAAVLMAQNGEDALDVSLTVPAIALPVNGSNAVTSYAAATGSFKAVEPDGTDVSSLFTLSIATGGNPQGLTGPYTAGAMFSGQTYAVTGGFDTGEDTASLTIKATGSGAYAGYIYTRRFTLTKTIGNTNVSNDRIATAISPPTILTNGSALQHSTPNTDGTVDVTFTWSWSGTETDIDKFQGFMRASTSATSYNIGDTPSEELTFEVLPDRRSITFYGLPADLHYTFGVRAVRQVDTDINAAGFINSSIAQPTLGSEDPYQPETDVDWQGTVDGQTAADIASAVVDFNASNNRNGTAVTAPSVSTTNALTHPTPNTDGSVNVTFKWTWSGDEGDIDGFLVYMRSATSGASYGMGTTPAEENVFTLSADKREIVIPGLPADLFYTFGVQAYRKVDPDIDADGVILSTLRQPTHSSEDPYNPETSVDWQGSVDGVDAADIATAATDFNASNNQNTDAITAPSVASGLGAYSHDANTDGSVDLKFAWSWGGTEADIDGFLIYVRPSSSDTAYSMGTTEAQETVFPVSADKRIIRLPGVAANAHYTIAVQAYRRVDQNADAAGIILSSMVQPTNPYQPSSTVSHGGNVTGSVDSTPVATVTTAVTNANAGLGTSGVVNTDKVPTAAVQANAITNSSYAVSTGTVSHDEGDEDTVQSVAITTTGEPVLLSASFALSLDAGAYSGYLGTPADWAKCVLVFRIYRGASLAYIYSKSHVLPENTDSHGDIVDLTWMDEPAAGSYTYSVTIEATSASDWDGADTWRNTIAFLSAVELKR